LDIATLIGIIGAFALVGWAIVMGGSFGMFLDVASVLIVIGGTFMSLLTNFPMARVFGMFSVARKTLQFSGVDPDGVIRKMVRYAEMARKEGMLALEEEAENEKDRFLRKGLRLAVDGTDPSLLEKILATDIDQQQARHREGKKILEAGGTYAPAFGMIGTLVGLIKMLANLDDPTSIGSGMAVALLTTFYGSLLANVVFLPLAGKLELRSNEEIRIREMVIDGIMAIQSGDSPRIVEEKLKSFLSPAVQQRIEQEREQKVA